MKIAIIILVCLSISVALLDSDNAKGQESSTNTTQKTPLPATNTLAALHAVPECRDYDNKLMSDVGDRWNVLLNETNFSSLETGKITARFKLNKNGNVSDIKISGSTNLLAAPVCIKSIKDCSPFPKWPDKMRSIVGQDFREMTLSFNLR